MRYTRDESKRNKKRRKSSNVEEEEKTQVKRWGGRNKE